jgi:peptidoglycan/xylan/chitin deacetylase (PgdA/CDA1 family)
MLAMNPLVIAAPVVVLGAVGLTSYAAVNARSQLFGPTIRQTAAARQLAITFDDGPNPAITPQLLDLLARYNAKSTFFVVGKFVRECLGLVKEISARGHLLGNHTDSHPNLFFCGPEETHQELLRCTDAIQQASWSAPVWFRPPFGYRSPWLSEIVHRQDMRSVMWTLLPGDWRAKPLEWLNARLQPIADHAAQSSPRRHANNARRENNRPENRIRENDRREGNVREGTASAVPKSSGNQGVLTPEVTLRPSGGDILCLHDGNFRQQNADRTGTLAALEYWLPRWRDLDLEFVTMNEAFGKVVEV